MTALQAFVAAAETLSFKEAAARLNVSASALSRQVRSLEDHLGTALFIRHNPGIELTSQGARYLVTAKHVMSELFSARAAVASEAADPLRISGLESFCAKWLVPHLPEFHAAHPGVEVQLEATLRYADFDRDPIDVAIRFGTGPWEGLHAEPIVDLEYFVVCSPALRDADPPLRNVADLAHHVWIHLTQTPDAWSDWTRAAGSPELRGERDLFFDHVGIALSAAESGQGVALSSRLLCAAEVANDRLCIPLAPRANFAQTYHLVCRPEGLEDARIIAFRDWLVAALA